MHRYVNNNTLKPFPLLSDLHDACTWGSYRNSEKQEFGDCLSHYFTSLLSNSQIAVCCKKISILLAHQAFTAFPQRKNNHVLLQAYPNVDVQAGIHFGFLPFSYITDWHLLGPSMSSQFRMHTLCRAHPVWNIIYGWRKRWGSLWTLPSNNPAPPDLQQDRRPRGQIPHVFVSWKAQGLFICHSS